MTSHRERGGGAMTGATGDLTPDETGSAFVPAELREVADPEQHADVTTGQASDAPGQRTDTAAPARQHPASTSADEGDERSEHEERF